MAKSHATELFTDKIIQTLIFYEEICSIKGGTWYKYSGEHYPKHCFRVLHEKGFLFLAIVGLVKPLSTQSRNESTKKIYIIRLVEYYVLNVLYSIHSN